MSPLCVHCHKTDAIAPSPQPMTTPEMQYLNISRLSQAEQKLNKIDETPTEPKKKEKRFVLAELKKKLQKTTPKVHLATYDNFTAESSRIYEKMNILSKTEQFMQEI